MSDLNYVPTPGKMIKAAREAKGVSLEEVAQKLFLSKQIIIRIENDDYSKIPAQVYAEGYLRAYAKLLEISSEKLLATFWNLNVYSDGSVVDSGEDGPDTKDQDECNLSFKALFEALFKNRRVSFMIFGLFIGVLLSALSIFAITKFDLFNKKGMGTESSPSVVASVVEEERDIIGGDNSEVIVPVVTINSYDEATKLGLDNMKLG